MTYTGFMAVVLVVMLLLATFGASIWAAVRLYEWLVPNRPWKRIAYLFAVGMVFIHLFYGWMWLVIQLADQPEPW